MPSTLKKLHGDTIPNLFILNKRFMAENVCILLNFLQNKDLTTRFNIRVHHVVMSKNLHLNQLK